jgi:hypothetical protein
MFLFVVLMHIFMLILVVSCLFAACWLAWPYSHGGCKTSREGMEAYRPLEAKFWNWHIVISVQSKLQGQPRFKGWAIDTSFIFFKVACQRVKD